MNGFTGLPTQRSGPDDPPDTPRAILPPTNYTPSTADQRRNWNMFTNFLREKGVAGSTDLDKRDQSLGLKYLDEYNKANPDNQVPAAFIPTAQYETYQIMKRGQFPGLSPEEAEYAFRGNAERFKDRPFSEVDGWLGSLTSTQAYQKYVRGTSMNKATGENVTTGRYNFGENFEDFVRSRNNPELQQQYLIQ